jgi:hypothetical protein
MKNAAITTGPGPVHPETGTRRLNLWRESTAGGQWGDMAIALAATATAHATSPTTASAARK